MNSTDPTVNPEHEPELGSGNQEPEPRPEGRAEYPAVGGERSMQVQGDVTDSVTILGDRNVVTVVKSVAPWAIRIIIAASVAGVLLQIPSFLKEHVRPLLAPPPQVEIVLDVSQRMRTEMDQPGQSKFDIARDAILEVLDTWEGSEVEVSLRLLGGSGGAEACEVFPSRSLLVDFTRDYEIIREKLRNLKPYGPEAPDAPLADTLQSSVQHLAEGGSPSQTIMVFTGGDDACGKSVQVILNALAKRSATGKAINSLTYLIVLASEKVGFTGVPGQEISVALAQTAREVKEEAQAASQSLPPTPTPGKIVKAVDVIANLAPDIPTAAPTSTTVAPTRPITATAVAYTVQNTPASPTSAPTPTAPFISQAMPTWTPVPKPTTPPVFTPTTPKPIPVSTPTYSPAPSATITTPATVVSATPTPRPTATPTSTLTPTATPSNTPPPPPTPTYTATATPMPTNTPTPTPTSMPSPTSTPTLPPITIRPLPPQNEVYAQNCPLIAQASGFNEFESNQATISSSPVGGGHTGPALKLDFTALDLYYSYSGWEAVLGDIAYGVDLTSYTSLKFYIRGAQGGEIPNVWLVTPVEGGDFRYFQDVEAYTPITNQWQEVVIPLTAFTAGTEPDEQIDLQHINKIQVVFEWYEETTSGTIYVDDLCVIR